MIPSGALDIVADVSAPTGISGLEAGYIRCAGFPLRTKTKSSQKLSRGGPDIVADISAPIGTSGLEAGYIRC